MERMQAGDPVRIGVLGAGAVGTYLGALLLGGGHDPLLIGRPSVLEPIRREGLKLVRQDGTNERLKVSTCVDIGGLSERFNIIFLTVKSYAVEEAVKDLDRLVAPDAMVVSLQNGVGSDEILIRHFGNDRVIAATLTNSVGFDEARCLCEYRRSGGIAWALYHKGMDVTVIASVLEATGLHVSRIASPLSLKWSKLLLNSVGSAQSAIVDEEPSVIVRNGSLFHNEQLAFRETAAAMRAGSIRIVDLPGFPARLVSGIMSLPRNVAQVLLSGQMAGARGGKSPSMRGDVRRGGPTENRYLNGASACLATRVGIKAPTNQILYELVEEVTQSEDLRHWFRHEPSRLLERLGRK